MDQRAETEVQIASWAEELISGSGREAGPSGLYLSAKVTPLTNPEWEQEYRVTEITPTAIQLMAHESPHPNELVCIELPDHLLLADVKNSMPRGNEFATDAARIVTLRKTPALEGATKLAKIEELMDDFRLQCKMQLRTIEASVAHLDPRTGKQCTGREPKPGSFVDRNLGSRFFPSTGQAAGDAARQSAENGPVNGLDMAEYSFNSRDIIPAPIVDAEQPSDASRVSPQSDHQSFAPPRFAPAGLAPAGLAPADLAPSGPAPSGLAPSGLAPSGHTPSGRSGFDWPPAPCVVTLVGFDAPEPQRLDEPGSLALHWSADEPRPLFEVTPRRYTVRPWGISIGIAASLAILLWFAPLSGPSRKGISLLSPIFAAELSATKRPPATVAAQAAASAATLPTPLHTDLSPVQVSLPPIHQTPIAAASLRATITATGVSWISVCSDGKERFENILAAGDTREIEFSHKAVVRLGNARAVDIKVNGKSIEPLGGSGAVRALELTPGISRFVPVNDRHGARACGYDQAAADPLDSPLAAR